MKRYFWIFILVALAAIFAMLFWHGRKQTVIVSSRVSELAQQAASVSQSASSVSAEKQKTNGSSQIAASSPSQAPKVNDREKTNEIRQYMESQNKPINFYVKVVDQDNNPLSGVKVKGEVTHIKVVVPTPWGDEDQSIPIEKETDLDGCFEVHDLTGSHFNFESIQKGGYEPEPFMHAYGTSGGSLENPMIFKMWSTNIHEQLITGNKAFDIVPDGRPYFIDLTKGSIAESGEGDLKIWVKRPEQITYGKRYDWSCELHVINGGLLAASDSSMYSAPADGYTPLFQFEQKIGSGWGNSTGPQRFYLKLANGKEYGRITIELMAYYNDQTPGLLRLSYALNPSGSRILR